VTRHHRRSVHSALARRLANVETGLYVSGAVLLACLAVLLLYLAMTRPIDWPPWVGL
jgi:hypothetical protein